MTGYYCDSCEAFFDIPTLSDNENDYICPQCGGKVRHRDTDQERADGEYEKRHEMLYGTTDKS